MTPGRSCVAKGKEKRAENQVTWDGFQLSPASKVQNSLQFSCLSQKGRGEGRQRGEVARWGGGSGWARWAGRQKGGVGHCIWARMSRMWGNTAVGVTPKRWMSSTTPSPDRTKAVSTPALTPQAMSVYTRSPMSRVCSLVKPVRSTASRAMSGSGLPMNLGRRPVARKSISHTLPQSGTEP